MSTPLSHRLLSTDMPDGRALVAEGVALGNDVTMGRSLLCEQYGVASEVAYKEKMRAEGRIMTAFNIGMQTWRDTAAALEKIHRESERRGFRVDRFQMQLDRRMGLPESMWANTPKETGPMMETAADWHEVSHVVPIQPHLGDFMIGSPASVRNTRHALEAGVNYIGNMSQFNWKYPQWPGDDVEQMAEMVKALGMMAAKSEEGAMVHSYLDDGYPAQFKDYCSYIGWAMFERHIVNDCVGASISVSYGGLTHHPLTKAAMILALEDIKPEGACNAFYHSVTTNYSTEIDLNFGSLAVDDLYIMLAKLETNSAAATSSVPVTEPIRIPTWDEIVQAQTVARRVAEDCVRLRETLDWSLIREQARQLTRGGRQFFENLLEGLHDLKVDTDDPLQLLVAVRRLGAVQLENRFGVGDQPQTDTELYSPRIATDTFNDFLERRQQIRVALSAPLSGIQTRAKLIVGSTDIHEYALFLLIDALDTLGIEAIVAGTSVDPEEFADLALEADADALLVSTHNGMALSYAEELKKAVESRSLNIPIAMGGTLNQDIEGETAPVDVRDDLRKLGVRVCDQITDVVDLLRPTA